MDDSGMCEQAGGYWEGGTNKKSYINLEYRRRD